MHNKNEIDDIIKKNSYVVLFDIILEYLYNYISLFLFNIEEKIMYSKRYKYTYYYYYYLKYTYY